MSLISLASGKLGRGVPQGRGWYHYECPFCHHHRQKFGVHAKTGRFSCFHCGKAGNVTELGVEYEAPLNRAGTAYPSLPNAIPGFVAFQDDPDALAGKQALQYAVGRTGLTSTEVRELGWGWSTDVRLASRLVIPVRMEGRVVQYVARAVAGQEPKDKVGFTEDGWLPKSQVVYGLDSIPQRSSVVLVEGVFDKEAVQGAGYRVIALLGTRIGKTALGVILQKRPRSITLLMDGDEAGRDATIRLSCEIQRRFRPVYRVYLPDGKDPDEVTLDCLRAIL